MIYRYVLDCDVAEDVLELSSKQRGRFIQIFRDLAHDPFQKGEQAFRDSIGRDIQKKKNGSLVDFLLGRPRRQRGPNRRNPEIKTVAFKT